MSAYSNHLTVQSLACHFLQNVSEHWRAGDSSGKAPVREAALELLIRALKMHGDDVRLVIAVLQTVLHVLYSCERDAVASDVTERTQSTIFVISFVQNEILPIANLFANVPQQNERIAELCCELTNFFDQRDDVDSTYDLLAAEEPTTDSMDSDRDVEVYESIELLDE